MKFKEKNDVLNLVFFHMALRTSIYLFTINLVWKCINGLLKYFVIFDREEKEAEDRALRGEVEKAAESDDEVITGNPFKRLDISKLNEKVTLTLVCQMCRR